MNTTPTTTVVTITRRSRNLRLAWTNEPETVRLPNGSSYLAIRTPQLADAGRATTPAQILAEYYAVKRRHGDSWFNAALFVGGRRIGGMTSWMRAELFELTAGMVESVSVKAS